MRNFFSVALIFSLIISAARGADAPSAEWERVSISAGAVETSGASLPAATNELVATLPASNLVAVLDANRAFNELLPKLAGFAVGGVDKLAKSIQDFILKTGIDASKIQRAVIGLNMESSQGAGVIVVEGIDPDHKQIEAAMKELGSEFKTSDYKGKTVYNVVSKAKSPAAGRLSIKTDDLALVSLGRQRVALGDMSLVKRVIDIQAGDAKGGVSAAMVRALNETRASALIRFALDIPENLRAEAATQGDLFKSISVIKIILGTIDASADFNLSLDAIIRTASQKDATELEGQLKGLVGLGKDIFAGGGDPKTNLFAQLLDQVKIGSKVNDVALSIYLPREVIEQLSKKETAPPADKK
jgi:hypothetical protein